MVDIASDGGTVVDVEVSIARAKGTSLRMSNDAAGVQLCLLRRWAPRQWEHRRKRQSGNSSGKLQPQGQRSVCIDCSQHTSESYGHTIIEHSVRVAHSSILRDTSVTNLLGDNLSDSVSSQFRKPEMTNGLPFINAR